MSVQITKFKKHIIKNQKQKSTLTNKKQTNISSESTNTINTNKNDFCENHNTSEKLPNKNLKTGNEKTQNQLREEGTKNINVKKPNNCYRKLLILADGCGRNLYDIFKKQLPYFKIEVIFKPNAKFLQKISEN